MSRRANGEGSIYQRKTDGRWAGSISRGDGSRKHFLGHTREEVARKLNAALAEMQKGVPQVSTNQTLGQYLDYWLASVNGTVRVRTFESYDLNIRRLKPLLGKMRMSMLNPPAVERAYGLLIASGLSKRSVVQAHTVLHTALKKAVKWGLLGVNPTEAVDVPRAERNEMKTLTEDEVRRLFIATAGEPLHALWVLLGTTGLRIGEALGLKWEDIDLEAGRLTVKRALQRQHGNGLVLVEPKTAKSRRTVYFPEGTVDALKEHRRRQVECRLRIGPYWQEHGLLFCREDGMPLDPSGQPAKLHLALRRAGLPRVRIHDLRHTAATLHLARGENPKVVQELLGHSNIATTMDIYSHVTPVMHEAAAKKMQSLFIGI